MIEKFGVFLFGFGAPRSLDKKDVADFLRCVAGRNPADAAVSGLLDRYEAIDGLSPLAPISRAQAAALDREISLLNIPVNVYPGMRCGEPSISDAVTTAAADGITKAVALTQAPQFATMVMDAYKKAAEDAVNAVGDSIVIQFVDSYGTHPGFIEAVCTQVKSCLTSTGLSAQSVPFVFTAHSLPEEDGKVERYIEEIKNGAAMISKSLDIRMFDIAFQSRGRAGGNWLGPSLEQVIEQTAAKSKEIVVCPLGFISENLETLYDLDIAAARHAQSLGIGFHRVKALNDSPHLIRAWAEIVREKIRALN